jgi:hypothetical protein
MRTFNKVKKYTKPLLELDEKITLLDCEMKKTKLGEAIANSTSGLYTITGFARDPAIPPIPEVPPIPAIPPTYEPVDPGPIADPNNFIWPEDQGDGSDPNAAPNIPDILYTTYNGEQVPALRQVEVDHGEGVTPLGLVFHTRAISSQVIGYLTNGGFNLVVQSGVFTTPGPYTPVQQAYLNAWNNRGTSGIFQYSTSKTIYLWGQIDCLFGSCFGGAQYYPANLTNETTPKADYVLYPYELVIPTDANGNTLPNQFITDPGVPEVPGIPGVPGIPEGPPRHIVISRNALDDPNYYPGLISPQGDIAGMGPNQVYPLLDIIRSSPSGPTRNNAIQQLNQWAKPGSKNRELLLQLGVPLEGASLPTNQQQIAQIQPIEPAQQRKGTTGVGLPRNFPTGPIDMSPSGMNYPKEWLPKGA